MSAFVVSDNHINALLAYANLNDTKVYINDGERSYSISFCDTTELQSAAEALKSQNVKSVAYRYQEPPADASITFRFVPEISHIQAVKACDCLNYQSCETPDYEHTAACQIIRTIRETAIHNLIGYKEAAWEL